MAVVTSAEEQDKIVKLLPDGNGHFYLGGSDFKSEGEWKWITGEKWEYDNWISTEPDNGFNQTEHYLEVISGDRPLFNTWPGNVSGKWNDRTELKSFITGYIMEVPFQQETIERDTDSDGISDYNEITIHNTDKRNQDTDKDGLTDFDEIIIHKSSPLITDTDNDGIDDYAEIKVHKEKELQELKVAKAAAEAKAKLEKEEAE